MPRILLMQVGEGLPFGWGGEMIHERNQNTNGNRLDSPLWSSGAGPLRQ
jgi:hypothetical protein